MSRLQHWLARACTELGLRIELGSRVTLASGRQIDALALIPELGGAKGMIIVSAYEQLRDVAKEVVEAGYGYSVLSEPDLTEDFDLKSYVEMFSDWGWASDAAEPPSWMV